MCIRDRPQGTLDPGNFPRRSDVIYRGLYQKLFTRFSQNLYWDIGRIIVVGEGVFFHHTALQIYLHPFKDDLYIAVFLDAAAAFKVKQKIVVDTGPGKYCGCSNPRYQIAGCTFKIVYNGLRLSLSLIHI